MQGKEDQLGLFAPGKVRTTERSIRKALEPVIPAVHGGDHATSLSAAKRARYRAATTRAQAVEILDKAGAHGMTDEELDTHFKKPMKGERARYGLMKAGVVVSSGKTRQTEAGNAATVWVLAKHKNWADHDKR